MLTIPSIIAHRGSSWDAPENTLAAFLLAWMEGADGIEADFQMTKDGEIVCVHDESLERTTGKSKQVSNCTLEEVRALDAGKWKRPLYRGQRIPTLPDVLSTVPVHGQIFIELKGGPEMIPVVKKHLKAAKIDPANVRIASFNVETLLAASESMPEYQRLLLCKRSTSDGPWEPSVHILEATMRMVKACGIYLDNMTLLTSLPPPRAKSGLPPPLPPTMGAMVWMILPAWTLAWCSLATLAISVTLPPPVAARTTMPLKLPFKASLTAMA
jgi:glycerophosphoryl diester phosphodiesterase